METAIVVVMVIVLVWCLCTSPRREGFPNTPYTVPYMREKISPDAWRTGCLYKPYPMKVNYTFTLT